MEKSLKERLKGYLLNIIELEGNRDAWEHFKTLDPNCDELIDVIMGTPFAKEAWEHFKELQPNKDDLLDIVKYSEDKSFKKEAETLLINGFSLDAETLESIVKNNNSDEAAKLLLKQNPNNDQLDSIVRYSNLSDEAAKEMLKQDQDIYELHEIIKHSSLKNEAWEKFLQQSPTTEEIINIIQETDFDDTAWNYLIQQNTSNSDLCDLIKDYVKSGKKRNETAEYVLNNNPSVSDLIYFIRSEIRVNDAWELMRKMTPDESELSSVIWILVRLGSVLKNEVAEWCLKHNPSQEDLWHILKYSNQKDEAAIRLITMPLELHEMANIIVESTCEPVLAFISKQVGFNISSINEQELIHEIANKILNEQELLDVNNWHNGNKHCVGGWAIQLNDKAQEIEKLYGSEIAACLLIPNYKHLIFADKQEVVKQLHEIKLS